MAQNLLGGFVSRYKGGSNASNFSSKVCVISLLITIDEDLENRNQRQKWALEEEKNKSMEEEKKSQNLGGNENTEMEVFGGEKEGSSEDLNPINISLA